MRALLFTALLAFSTTVLAQDNPVVVMETNKGTIKIELRADLTPITVDNFVRYVSNSYFDGLIFHRVIGGFMIQGGGFDEDMVQKSTYDAIKNEADTGLSNARGTIAMARTSVVDSATSQFFINLGDNSRLDFRNETSAGYGYTAFGRVTEGMDVVDMIAQVATGNKGGHADVPLESVVLTSVTLEE